SYFLSYGRPSRLPTTILHAPTTRQQANPSGRSGAGLYNRRMRSRLNPALVVVAGILALVLTVIRQSPEGVVSLALDTQEVRAAPGQPRITRHDLSALKIFNLVLLRIRDRYVDPSRIEPRKMLYA